MNGDLKIPNSACWNITSRCNDTCAFCYRELNSQELSFDNQKKVIDKIAEVGIKKLTFTGGEPLLLEKINNLILYAKCKGIMASLTTNAILLENNKTECGFLFENLDWLTLSLDGADDRVQSQMGRNAEHAKRVKQILTYANEYPKRKCKLKINTVVSKLNKDDLIYLADIVKEYKIDRWKLFQFTPVRGKAVDSKKIYNITDQDFNDVANNIKVRLAGERIILSICGRTNIESAHFVIFPDGDIRISNDCKDRVVGNILKDDIIGIWCNGCFFKELHEQRTGFIS